jgi:crotonobetaine/carnitine-CoA ligase
MQTVFEAFTATASAAPEQPFLCAPPAPGRAYHPDGVELTYRVVRDEVARMKRAYEAAGYGHGHRVALLFENRPEFFFHYLALNALGTSVVPVNPDYRHDELAYQMDHSEADLAVAISERVGALEAVAAERARPLPVVDAGAWPATRPVWPARPGCSTPPAPPAGPRAAC